MLKQTLNKTRNVIESRLQNGYPERDLFVIFRSLGPLFCDVSWVALTEFQLGVFLVLENQVRNSCKVLSKMESQRVPKFGRM